jgi:dethiobiotin synthetase
VAHPLVLIGTGTSVGKTYVAERLLRAFAVEGRPSLGYKPVETGVTPAAGPTDAESLALASTFHVKPGLARFTFRDPVSPHLAARREARPLDLDLIRAEIRRGAALAPVLVVELPGGAFSPLADHVLTASFLRTVHQPHCLLVAPDRIGVLHDIAATTRACAAVGLPLLGIVLSATADPDASTGSNAPEVRLVTAVPLLSSLPRLPSTAPVAETDPARALARHLWPRLAHPS